MPDIIELGASVFVDSWKTVRQKMGNQQKVTVVFKKQDGKTIHIRKATQPEPHQKEILDALSISCISKMTHGIRKTHQFLKSQTI